MEADAERPAVSAPAQEPPDPDDLRQRLAAANAPYEAAHELDLTDVAPAITFDPRWR